MRCLPTVVGIGETRIGRFPERTILDIFPANTPGGLLSQGHSEGFFHIPKGVRQLRDNAGRRQVKDSEVALVTGAGGQALGSPSALLLGKGLRPLARLKPLHLQRGGIKGLLTKRARREDPFPETSPCWEDGGKGPLREFSLTAAFSSVKILCIS